MRLITSTELIQHNHENSCWLAIHGKVWEVTTFLKEHPGGANLLLGQVGRDASKAYSTYHSAELVGKTLGKAAFVGEIDTSTLAHAEQYPEEPRPKGQGPPLNHLLNLDDFEKVAEKTVNPSTWAYIAAGADDEISVRENRRIYQKVFLRGRVLRNVTTVDSSCTILGHRCSMPVYTSPVGLAKLVHAEGECAIAAADGKEGVIQVVNTVSSMPIETIMDARVSKQQPIFWQLYADKDIEKSKAFIERVERAGVKAIWLTVDSPVVGKRERDERSKLDIGIQTQTPPGDTSLPSVHSGIAKAATGFINAGLDWQIVHWLRSVTTLPLVIKGIQSVEDAVAAFEYGVQGIVLSNHGGRSQDTSQPPLLTLLEIRRYAPHILGKGMEVFVDGGVRRGTDIIKALALGATAVGIGRPILHSLAGGYGEHGARRMLQILREELHTNMAFIGVSNVSSIQPEMVNTSKVEKFITGNTRL